MQVIPMTIPFEFVHCEYRFRSTRGTHKLLLGPLFLSFRRLGGLERPYFVPLGRIGRAPIGQGNPVAQQIRLYSGTFDV